MSCGVMIRGRLLRSESASTFSASGIVSSTSLRLAKAATRMSAPSSSRMLFVMFEAMNSITSSGIAPVTCSAFLWRIASRVSRSGGWMSVIRPILKRLRSRSSSVEIASGGRSEDSTIWRWPRAGS